MNIQCPQNVWNHTGGCSCPPARHRAESPVAGTSPFGSHLDVPAPTEPRPLSVLNPAAMPAWPKVEPLTEIPDAERRYENVEDLPRGVQNRVFAAAMEWVAEEHFGRPSMSSHEYDPLVDVVAERADEDLHESYEEWMDQHDLDGRKSVATKEETS